MDVIDTAFDPLRDFAKDSVRLVKRCHKPDRKEFSKVAFRTAVGFVVMGFVGFFVYRVAILLLETQVEAKEHTSNALGFTLTY
ncbi:Protein transport protein Sec61 subunit gamma-2 [Bienertia sinuspersici]